MRILITEEALQTGKGHWPAYIGCIADGLRTARDEVDVIVHRQATPEVLERVGGTPWFSRNCWLDPKSQGALGGLRHNLRFRSELRAWLCRRPAYDWVCALTVRLQHLLAFALLSRDQQLPPATRFLLLFVQGFGQYAGPGKPTTFPRNSSTRLARFCFSLLAPSVRSGRVVLAAETRGMQDELQRFTGLPVSLFPHPVPAPNQGVGDGSQTSGDREQEAAFADEGPGTKDAPHALYQGPKTKDQGRTAGVGSRTSDLRPLTISCPGFARHEKGNDLLQDAILKMLAGQDGDRFRFIMQWPEAFALPDGRPLGPDPLLFGDSRVEFLNQSLDAAAYEALLAHSDLVVLPYRRRSYHHRVSRVAIEAASRGIPLIYTSETWAQEIAELAGCGVPIRDETADAVVDAMGAALLNHAALAQAAKDSAYRVAAYHSATGFRDLLSGNVLK